MNALILRDTMREEGYSLKPLLYASCEDLAKRFESLKSPRGLAGLLEVPYEYLVYYIYKTPNSVKYRQFSVPKKSGGHRIISVPKKSLAIVQRKLSQVLYAVYKPRYCVHGFVADKSIVTNAKYHTRKKFVLNLDLEDFFPAINFGRVRGLFMAKPYKMSANLATFMAQICCHDNGLPIGAPTSPIISNLVCMKMDAELQRFSKEHGLFYTRYADDITFSINREKLPIELVAAYSAGFSDVVLGNKIRSVIEENGFRINAKKVRLRYKSQSQEVTGLTVNKFVNVNRKYIRNIYSTLRAWDKYGLAGVTDVYVDKYAKKPVLESKSVPPFLDWLRGKIEFIGSVRGKNDPIYQRLLNRFFELKSRNSSD